MVGRKEGYLDAIIARFIAQSRTLRKIPNDIFDLRHRQRAWLVEGVTRPSDLKLDIARTDRVRIQCSATLSPWMAKLGDEERAMSFGYLTQFTILLETSIVVVAEDGISETLDGVVPDHGVAGHDDADFAFTPSLVKMDELWGRDATSGLSR